MLAVVASACSSSPRTTGTATPSASAAHPTTSAASGASRSAPFSSPGATAAAATKAPLPAKAPPTVPPAAGTYTYAQTGETKAGPFAQQADTIGTLDVAPATNASSGRRQTQTRHQSSSQSREQTLLFTPNAILLEGSVTRFGSQSISCKTKRPLVAIKLPLRVGASWSDAGDCAGGHVSFTAKVLRTERRNVERVHIVTFIVHHVIRFTGDGVDQTTDLTSWLSPDYRIAVRAVERSSGIAYGTQFTQDMTENLQSLSPA